MNPMMPMRLVAYHRVSTARQGRSGLGLAAQEAAIQALARDRSAELVAAFTEVESGKRADRPELLKSLQLARLTGATLAIARLDRLSRNAAFLLTLRDSGVRFVAADIPEANDLTVGIMALVAQQQREAIAKRTKEALAAAKARGTKLGNPNGAAALRRAGKGGAALRATVTAKADAFARELGSVLAEIRAEGHASLREIAGALDRRGIRTRRAVERVEHEGPSPTCCDTRLTTNRGGSLDFASVRRVSSASSGAGRGTCRRRRASRQTGLQPEKSSRRLRSRSFAKTGQISRSSGDASLGHVIDHQPIASGEAKFNVGPDLNNVIERCRAPPVSMSSPPPPIRSSLPSAPLSESSSAPPIQCVVAATRGQRIEPAAAGQLVIAVAAGSTGFSTSTMTSIPSI